MEEELLNKILTKVVDLDGRFDKMDQQFDKLVIKVIDMDERMKSLATKDELAETRSNIITTIDRFAKLHETLDQELVALRSKYDRLEERLMFVENKLGIKTV